MWYVLSKTLAEEAAWKFTKEKGIDLVMINLGVTIGPLLQPTLNASAAAIYCFFDGMYYVTIKETTQPKARPLTRKPIWARSVDAHTRKIFHFKCGCAHAQNIPLLMRGV